jgi:toxin CcdB
MAQFDVFTNPIARAKRAYPLVVVLQSDIAETGRERIVAPLVPRSRLSGTVGRMTPHVDIDGVAHVVLVPALAAVPAADLKGIRGQLVRYRSELVASLDYLFLGV